MRRPVRRPTLVNYSMAQAKIGEPITHDELSGLIDEDRPKCFYDFIKAKDYGLSDTSAIF